MSVWGAAAAVVGAAVAATTAGIQADQASKASAAAKRAQAADAAARVREQNNTQSKKTANGIMSMANAPLSSAHSTTGADPFYLQQRGYAPSGQGGASQPTNPLDPLMPDQQVQNPQNGTKLTN